MSKRREASSSAMSSACAVRGSTLSMPLRADYGVEAARGQLFGYVFGLRGARLDVVHAVAREVLFYVFRGGEPAFDRGDAAGARGEEGGEAAYAGVEFEHFARAALRGEGRGAAIERERLFRIYLEEGRGFKGE